MLLDVALLLHAAAETGSRATPHAQIEAIASACRHVATWDQAETATRRGGTIFVNRPLIITVVLDSLRHLGAGCEAMHRIAARMR